MFEIRGQGHNFFMVDLDFTVRPCLIYTRSNLAKRIVSSNERT